MEVYTIGFTKKTAKEFFHRLRDANVARLIDVRLNNTSQLAGFAKRDDLKFFLEELHNIEYRHEPLFAPTKEILDAYRKQKGPWEDYAESFIQLMTDRRIETEIDRALFETPAVLLCSEASSEHCHRRLVVDYLRDKWGDLRQIDL